MPRTSVVERTRVVELLRRRHDVRLTTVIGGAGSGKTTALGQALDVDDGHVDVWHPCSRADRDEQLLATRLLDACADALDEYRVVGADDPLGALGEIVLAASPTEICFVLDDVHVLGATTIVEDLLRTLPANGHVLVAGRSLTNLNVARFDASGQLVEIKQDDLLLDDAELVDFANRRGIDAEHLDDANRWPAFVELASTGSRSRSRRFLREEALGAIGPERRERLSAFAFVGGGDDAVARAVTGWSVDDLVSDLPLVAWDGDDARLHDLWVELLDGELSLDQQRSASRLASEVHLARRSLDRAVLLGAQVEDWEIIRRALIVAVRMEEPAGTMMVRLERWVSLLPPAELDAPIVLLARGLVERDRDPTSTRALTFLDEAATGFRESGDPDLELLALQNLALLSRLSGGVAGLASAMGRLHDLGERYGPARRFDAFGEALMAIAEGRPDKQVVALERVVDVDLPLPWRYGRDSLMAHGLYLLGRPQEALERLSVYDDMPALTLPGAGVTRSQALWFAGRPHQALEEYRSVVDRERNARDRFKGEAWIAVMEAMAGHVDRAVDHLGLARQLLGEQPPLVGQGQLVGVELLLRLARGDEAGAGDGLASVLSAAPLGEGVSEQNLRPLLALSYVLVPETRAFWDEDALGPAQLVARDLAAALLSAREGSPRAIATMVWPGPAVVAANFPVRWAVEFALHGVVQGRQEGRSLIAWLCEHWGDSARAVLRESTDADEALGAAASDVLAHTPVPPTQRVALDVLGTLRLTFDGYETADPEWRRERVRALMTWLVLHRGGQRDELAYALWPELPVDRALKNLRTTLNYLHGVLEPRRSTRDAPWFVRADNHRIDLQPDLEVDLWAFDATVDRAEAAERAGTPSEALPLLLDAVARYRGELAAGLDYGWLDLERIHVRSRFVRSSCRAGELLTATGRAAEAVDVFRGALRADEWNERTYRGLIDAYESLGDLTAAGQVAEHAEEALGALTPRVRSTRR